MTFEPGDAPNGYCYDGMDISFNHKEGFCWVGSFYIINTEYKNAEAIVTATCTWIPCGEGGGGSGVPPPPITGTGIGIAVAQPGIYWNSAEGTNVLALGGSTKVFAYKDDGEFADSTWSHSAKLSFEEETLTSVKTVGTNSSDSAWDSKVHSKSHDYPDLSDDEPFTVVSVVLIEAEPDVVCIGHEHIAYTVTTQPEGFNHMVSYTPADTGTPDVHDVVARCGSSSATTTVTVISVESETVSTIPADRSRTTLGIGEKVTLTITPSTSVTWSVTGGGSVLPITGNSTTFTASKSPSTSTIHATIGGADCTKGFTVIAPASITSTKKADVGHGAVGPPNNQIGAYTTYDIIVNPATVSFKWSELRENIPAHNWTWPDGTPGGISVQTPTWSVGYANDTVDHISSGPYPIGRIHDGANYVDFDYKVDWKEEYKNEAGTWTEFVAKEDTLTEYKSSDQKSRQTHMGAPGGWQGPWQ